MKRNSTQKKAIFSILLFVLPLLAIAQVDVTFKVDMTGVDMTNATGVYIVGDYELNNWVHSEMTLESDNIYSVTLSLTEGVDPIYYYTIVTDWSTRETVPAECANSGTKTDEDPTKVWEGDRLIVVPAQAVTISEPYGGCATATSAITSKVNSFKVIAVSGGVVVKTDKHTAVSVYSIDGASVFNGQVEGNEKITCSKGIYIVNVAGVNSKVIVK